MATDAALSDDEREMLDAIYAEINEEHAAAVRSAYTKATGDDEGASEMSLDAMASEIRAKAPPDFDPEARRRVAEERAGLREPSADPSSDDPLVLLYRQNVTRAARLNALMQERFGRARAQEIQGALPLVMTWFGGCD